MMPESTFQEQEAVGNQSNCSTRRELEKGRKEEKERDKERERQRKRESHTRYKK